MAETLTEAERLERLRHAEEVMHRIIGAAILLVLDQEDNARFAPDGVWVKLSRWRALKDAVYSDMDAVRAVQKAMGRVDAHVILKGVELRSERRL